MSIKKIIKSNQADIDFFSDTKLEVIGEQIPKGKIRVSGAKNSATRLMAASLLTNERVHLSNFPTNLVDVRVKSAFLQRIGAIVNITHEDNTIDITVKEISNKKLNNYNYPIRTTYLLAAGQLMRNEIAYIPYPGGCKIGERKYDLHVMVWEKFGCKVKELEDCIEIRCKKLKPVEIQFPFPTVGGTENALLCASITLGTTIIKNAYITPEIEDLISLLKHMGVSIQAIGNSEIRVNGSQFLMGTSHSVIPDRIEALTWIVYVTLSKGDVIIEDIPFNYMEVPFIHLKEAGIDVFKNSRDVYINPTCLFNKSIQPFELACGTYPGIISDMQPFYVLLALKAEGTSRIIDYRYPDRTSYLEELLKMCNGYLDWSPGSIRIQGPAKLKGADVKSTDLRGSMAVVLAGLIAEGKTTISNIAMALRGYNNLLEKFSDLGISYNLLKS